MREDTAQARPVETSARRAIRAQLAKEAFNIASLIERIPVEWPKKIKTHIGSPDRHRDTHKMRDDLIGNGCDLQLILGCCKELARGKSNPRKLLVPFEPDTTHFVKCSEKIKEALQEPIFNPKNVQPQDEAWRLMASCLIALPAMLDMYASFIERILNIVETEIELKDFRRYLMVTQLGDHIRGHTGNFHWDFVAAVVRAFGGDDSDQTLKKAYQRGQKILATWQDQRTESEPSPDKHL